MVEALNVVVPSSSTNSADAFKLFGLSQMCDHEEDSDDTTGALAPTMHKQRVNCGVSGSLECEG